MPLADFGADVAKATMSPQDLTAPSEQFKLLNISFPHVFATMVGKPIELIDFALPPFASGAIAAAAKKGLEAPMQVALRPLQRDPYAAHRPAQDLATASGAAGGAFGPGHIAH